MKTIKILYIVSICISTLSFISEKEDPFPGYLKIEDCLEEIPVEYSTKKAGPFLEAAERLKGEKIVLITLNKKQRPSYEYFYLVTSETSYGQTAYLTSPEDFKNDTPSKSAYFLKYKEKKHFFFNADCFNDKLEKSSELSDLFTEK